MGRDKKDKKDKPSDTIDTKKLNPKTGLIDSTSIQEYKSAYAQYKSKHGNEANPKLEEHIEMRLHKTVDEQKKKRKRDITSVTASTAAGTVVPFSGIPIMVATTMVQCVGFSASLGLIPIANVRSFQDANTLAKQLTATLQKATTSGMKAAIEAFVLEVLKQSGIGYWLWDEILKDIVIEITSGVVMDSVWVLTPLFLAPKYYLHRKLIKKMYVALGEKAIVVHKAWVTNHLFLGKPETVKNSADETVATGVPAAAIPSSYPGFPSAYPSAYPTTGQLLYESNSDEGVPYPVYYQPAFASSEHHAEAHPQPSTTPHSNSYPHYDPHRQYAHYPPSYPMHPPHEQSNSSSGPQHQQWYTPQQFPPQQGYYDSSSNYSQLSPAGYNPLVSHIHTSSMPELHGPNGSSTNTHIPGQNYSQAPPVGHPQNGQNLESGHKYTQSTPQLGGYVPPSSHSGPTYSQAPAAGYPPQSYHGAYNSGSYPSGPPFQQAVPTGSSQHQHSQSESLSGASSYSVQQSHSPSPYPTAEQKLYEKMSYGRPSIHHQQYLYAAPGSDRQTDPPPKQAEAC